MRRCKTPREKDREREGNRRQTLCVTSQLSKATYHLSVGRRCMQKMKHHVGADIQYHVLLLSTTNTNTLRPTVQKVFPSRAVLRALECASGRARRLLNHIQSMCAADARGLRAMWDSAVRGGKGRVCGVQITKR